MSTYNRRSGFGFGSFGSFWGKRTGSYGRTGSGYRSGGRRNRGTTGGNPSAYRNCCNTFERKIESFRCLVQQASGPAKHGRPTPATLNTFANLINKGAIIQTISTAQISRWARSARKSFNSRNASTTTCKNILAAKFGRSVIKAVAKSKTGGFMVATSPIVNGRPFCFPK
jgi:hypothetical protein